MNAAASEGSRNRIVSRINRVSARGLTAFVVLVATAVNASTVHAQVPIFNDLCEDAIGPVAVPSNTTGSTDFATTDIEFQLPPTCVFSITGPGVWYTVVGTGNTMTATTCTPGITNFDTDLHVYCDCDAMICVNGNDDQAGPITTDCDFFGGNQNFGSTVSWCSEPGAVYLILVSGYVNDRGRFDLGITDDGVACGAPTAECDGDGDGVINEDDECPDDIGKSRPGACGLRHL